MAGSSVESALVKRLIRGEEEAFGRLVSEYRPRLEGLLRSAMPNLSEEDREEIIQDTFLQVEAKITTFDPSKGSLSTWMSRIAINKARDVWRKKDRERRLAEEEPPDGQGVVDLPWEEIRRRLRETLPDRTYNVLEWSALGISQFIMAEWLNTTVNNIKQMKYRGVKVLQDIVEELKREEKP